MDNRFYIDRNRFYAGLVIFIFGTALFVGGLPKLRARIGARLVELKQAASGYSSPPAIEAQVGQNTEPFPAQYEKPITIPQKSALPLLTIGPNGIPQILPQAAREVVQTPSARTGGRPRRTLRIPTTVPGQTAAEPSDQAQPTQQAQSDQQATGTDASQEPVFSQGAMEKEAYNLVLGKYTTVSGMVTGNNAGLQFKGWGASKREEDTYWVRLTFFQTSSKTDQEYIWEVKISAKQVTPLNYNARSLPQS